MPYTFPVQILKKIPAEKRYLFLAILLLPVSMFLSGLCLVRLLFLKKDTGISFLFTKNEKLFWLLFVTYAFFQSLFVISPMLHIAGIIGHYLLYWLIIYLMAQVIKTRQDINETLLICIFSGVIAAFTGILFIAGLEIDLRLIKLPWLQNEYLISFYANAYENGEFRKERLPIHANILCTLLIMTSFITLGCYLNKELRVLKNNSFYLAALSLQTCCLMLTQSRIGYAAYLTGILLLFVFYKKQNFLILFFIFLTVSAVFFPEKYLSIYHSLVNFASVAENSERIETWLIILKVLNDYPLGIGILNYEIVYDLYRHNVFLAHSHNWFLQTFLESGLPGGIVFFAFFFSVLKTMLSNEKYIFLPVSVAAFIICNTTDYMLADTRMAFLLTVVLFLGLKRQSLNN